MRILIAEDDVTFRLVLAGILEKNGHEVVETANGAEAWQVMQQDDAPRLAILDWLMPEMDGLEVCRRVRASQTDQVPYLIMLTSKGEKENIIEGLAAGADDYLSKPFNAGELSARVNVGLRMIEMQNKLLTAMKAVAYEASHDPLTGIYNRRSISEILTKEIAREERQQAGLAVGICDIDHFKRINDTYGHQVGDEVLCGVVGHLEGSLRKYDSLGRIGGEEFLVITPGISAANAQALFERLRAALAETPIPTSAGNISITISIGVRLYGAEQTENALLSAADSALYQAKREGRNCVRLAITA